MNVESVPDLLQQRDQWVVWGVENIGGMKIPVSPDSESPADTTDPETWCDFETAVEYHRENGTKGIGFVFTDDDMIVGIDLDDIRDENGLCTWGREVLEDVNSFSEWSASGEGAHIYAFGTMPGDSNKAKVGDGGFEMYESGRFFAMTGDHVEFTPSMVEVRNDTVHELYEEYLSEEEDVEGENTSQSSPSQVRGGDNVTGNSLSDEEVVVKAKSSNNGGYFSDLWEGNWEEHSSKWSNNSHSEADLALCSMLAFWTANDRSQIDRIFRDSELMREKWNRDDYRERTLEKAIDGNDNVYSEEGWDRVRWIYGNSEIPKRSARDAAFNMLRNDYTFATIRETSELLWYDKGVYKEHGESVVSEALESSLGEHFSTREVREITRRIKSATFYDIDEFGADESEPKICVGNGVIDLTDFSFTDHSPADLFLTKIPIEYDPDAKCPKFDSFLDDVLKKESDKNLIYEMLGYCLWPGYDIANKFLILHGEGANGKSTLLRVIREFLGEATTSWDIQDLSNNRFAKSDLHEALANIAGDLPATKLTQTGVIKKLTGGDSVIGEKKHKPSFTFENRAKLIFAANNPPVIDDPSRAMSRRLMAVEMPYTFTREDDGNPDAVPTHELRKQLTTSEELSGILNKALEGLERIKKNGFSQHETPEELRNRYREISDPIKRFANGCLTNDTIDKTKKSDVLEAYNNWAEESGAPTKSSSVFHRTLQQDSDIQTRQSRVTLGDARPRVYEGLWFTEKGMEYSPTRVPVDEEHRGKEKEEIDEVLS